MNKKNSLLLVGLLLPLVLNALFFWFVYKSLNGGYIALIDQSLLTWKTNNLNSLSSLWSQNNLGHVSSIAIPLSFFGKILSWLLFRIFDNQTVVYVIFYFLTSYFVYLTTFFSFIQIQKRLFKSNSIVFPMFSAFFYAFNFSAIVNTGILDSNFHVLALAPILLCILIELLNGAKGLKYFFLEILVISLIISNIPFALGFLLTMYIPYFIITVGSDTFKIIRRYILIVFSTLLTSSFFLYSYFYAYKKIIEGAFYTGVSKGGYIFLTNGISGLFQFIFDWTTQIFYFPNEPHSYFHYYLGPIGLLSSYLLWLLLVIIIIYNKSILKNRTLLYLLFTIILSLFFIKGDQNPFSSVNMFIYRINPLMNILRTPSSKFSLPIMLYFSALLLTVLNIIKNKQLLILIYILIVLQTLLFFKPMRLIGYSARSTERSVGFISSSYIHIVNFINNTKKEGAIYMYPNSYAGYLKTEEHTFLGRDPITQLIDRPVIHPDTTTMTESRDTINKILPQFDPILLGNSSIRYILLRRDFDPNHLSSTSQNIDEVQKSIIKSKAYKNVYSSNEFDLYEISNKYYKNLISLELNSLSTHIDYEKISSDKYLLKLGSIYTPHIINFNNTADSGWKLKSDNSLNTFKLEDTNKFSNRWLVTPKDKGSSGNKKTAMTIYYEPQKYFVLYAIISIISYSILAIVLIKFWKLS